MTTKNEVRVFGMHKAGTSFLMKALSHFCHRNNVTLASTPFGMLPLTAYDKGVGGMDRKAVMDFLSYDPDLQTRIQAFSKTDYKKLDVINDRLTKAQIISIGDKENEKRVSFYRNSSVPVWSLDVDTPALRIIRNPLSIVKSAYFSHLKTHSTVGWDRLAKQRKVLAACSKSKGFWKTYEFMREDLFYHCTEGPLKTLASWPEDTRGLQTYRMEDMTTAPSSFLLHLWQMLGGDMEGLKFVPPEILTFEHQSGGRKPGQVDGNNHMRSGDPEEWRKLLPKDLIKQIRTDYGPLLEEFYPSSLGDQASIRSFSVPPKPVLRELEGVYTQLMESRKDVATAAAENTNLKGRIKTILEQRDKSAETFKKRFEDMKHQRDKVTADLKAAKALKVPQVNADGAKVTKLVRELETARKALVAMEQQKQSNIDALKAKLEEMTTQRDMALANQNTFQIMRDDALAAYKTMMQFRDDALLAAQSKQTQLQSAAESRFKDMKGQRDKILAEANTRFEDMKTQRDKALEAQTSMKSGFDASLAQAAERFEDMKQQRDKAAAAQTQLKAEFETSLLAETKAVSEAASRFEDMKVQRDKALDAQASMKASRDTSLAQAAERFEDMKTQRDKALEAQTSMKSGFDISLAQAAERFEDMKQQRDKAVAAQTQLKAEFETSLLAETKAVSEAASRFEDMKGQRDKALDAQASMKASRDTSLAQAAERFEDMKTQRDKALETQTSMKSGFDTSLAQAAERFEDMKQQRDKAIQAASGGATGEAYKKLEAQLKSMKDQRDKALDAQASMKASRDTSLAEASTRFEDMKAQRDKAIQTATGGASGEAYKKLEAQLNDMKAQRDKALASKGAAKAAEPQAKILARLDDMKAQRDKAIEQKSALKSRFEDMKAQRDKLLERNS